MSDQNIPPDAAAAIDRYVHQSIEKINDNAGALFSRIIEANNKALSAIKDMETRGRSIGRQLDSAVEAASRASKAAAALDERMKIAQNDIEDILTDLGIARTGVDGINDIIGKVVHLKSDRSSTMTAAKLADNGGVLCIWFSSAGLRQEVIPVAALEVLSHD